MVRLGARARSRAPIAHLGARARNCAQIARLGTGTRNRTWNGPLGRAICAQDARLGARCQFCAQIARVWAQEREIAPGITRFGGDANRARSAALGARARKRALAHLGAERRYTPPNSILEAGARNRTRMPNWAGIPWACLVGQGPVPHWEAPPSWFVWTATRGPGCARFRRDPMGLHLRKWSATPHSLAHADLGHSGPLGPRGLFGQSDKTASQTGWRRGARAHMATRSTRLRRGSPGQQWRGPGLGNEATGALQDGTRRRGHGT
eukprot:7069494-Pyramimonas_sp.AAC.1